MGLTPGKQTNQQLTLLYTTIKFELKNDGPFPLGTTQCCAVIYQMNFHCIVQRDANMKNTVIHSYLKRK
jgi:hypothetical protein